MHMTKDSKFHIAMFPWFALGHLTPYLHLSNELAQRGHKISFLLPNKVQIQWEATNLHPNLITFHPLAASYVKGLPLDAETASDIPIVLTTHLATTMNLTCDQIVFCSVVSAATLAMLLVPACKVFKDKMLMEAEMVMPPPGYPSSTVVLHVHEALASPDISSKFGSGITFYDHFTTSMKECDAISIRTCQEIKGKFCDHITSHWAQALSSFIKRKRLLQIITGALPKPNQKEDETNSAFNDRLDEWESKNYQIITWFWATLVPSINLQFGCFQYDV
ncbi:anthocyanidin 3-O-glucoside 2'''-O-xylosyltransferase-like [Camellia sinensis]|uniref:anthocyanidin 3-O-glucoside 2'''-O-xylosyltransferase-like n=1 Tax=Camellia sinensis TaxID=4442 RepID=UPI0010360387|nr:anthocyanidin 3-O-glucoside 2'''-O-xylosyltransferase-like [Camellia sinensis]